MCVLFRFNTCSCCCGHKALCCGHTTVRLTIKERSQGLYALDDGKHCFFEKCCLKYCCGEGGEYIGKCCCFQPCVNPCNANCCMINNIFMSTNDPQELINLLKEKCQHTKYADI